jgi:hypothetical protein
MPRSRLPKLACQGEVVAECFFADELMDAAVMLQFEKRQVDRAHREHESEDDAELGTGP